MLHNRLDAFDGIGQKKAAMAVEILERDLRVSIKDLQGSDIAYDVHLRRVFLRTGLARLHWGVPPASFSHPGCARIGRRHHLQPEGLTGDGGVCCGHQCHSWQNE